jgi:hypothetical protein
MSEIDQLRSELEASQAQVAMLRTHLSDCADEIAALQNRLAHGIMSRALIRARDALALTAESSEAYRRKAAHAALERAAAVCDEIERAMANGLLAAQASGRVNKAEFEYGSGKKYAAGLCADEIRAMKERV